MIIIKDSENYTFIELVFKDEYKLKAILDYIKPLLQCYGENYRNNPLYKQGLWDGLTKFYRIYNKTNLIVYRGFKEDIINFFKDNNINYIDKTFEYKFDFDIDVFISELNLPFKPYKHQIKALEYIKQYSYITFRSATGSGKSLIIYMLYRVLKEHNFKKILLLVPTIDLVLQMQNDFKDYNYNENDIMKIGGKYKFNKTDFENANIIISTWQSFKNIPNEYIKEIDAFILDEAHTINGDILKNISTNLNTKVKIGLTATIPNIEYYQYTFKAFFGVIKTLITNKGLIEKGYATPTYIYNIILKHNRKPFIKYNNEKDFITTDIKRNTYIAHYLLKFKKDDNIVALYRENEHAFLVAKIIIHLQNKINFNDINLVIKKSDIKDNKINIAIDKFRFKNEIEKGIVKDIEDFNILIMGGFISTNMRNYLLNRIKDNRGLIVLANWNIMKAGINIKALKKIAFIHSLKSYISVLQAIGRVMRKFKNKNKAIIYDFIDIFNDNSFALRQLSNKIEYYINEEMQFYEKEINIK